MEMKMFPTGKTKSFRRTKASGDFILFYFSSLNFIRLKEFFRSLKRPNGRNAFRSDFNQSRSRIQLILIKLRSWVLPNINWYWKRRPPGTLWSHNWNRMEISVLSFRIHFLNWIDDEKRLERETKYKLIKHCRTNSNMASVVSTLSLSFHFPPCSWIILFDFVAFCWEENMCWKRDKFDAKIFAKNCKKDG